MRSLQKPALILGVVLMVSSIASADKLSFVRIDHIQMNGLLSAIAHEDYKAFIACGTPELNNSIDEARFKELTETLAPSLSHGFTAEPRGKSQNLERECVLLWQVWGEDKDNNTQPYIIVTKTTGHGGGVIDFELK